MKATHRKFDVFAARCPSREAFDHIFSRWGMLVLARLAEGTARFRELGRGVDGISERMLSRTLKVLVDQGLVDRKEYDEKPPRVEYSLTPSGRRISDSVRTVIDQLYLVLDERRSEGDPS